MGPIGNLALLLFPFLAHAAESGEGRTITGQVAVGGLLLLEILLFQMAAPARWQRGIAGRAVLVFALGFQYALVSIVTFSLSSVRWIPFFAPFLATMLLPALFLKSRFARGQIILAGYAVILYLAFLTYRMGKLSGITLDLASIGEDLKFSFVEQWGLPLDQWFLGLFQGYALQFFWWISLFGLLSIFFVVQAVAGPRDSLGQGPRKNREKGQRIGVADTQRDRTRIDWPF